MDDHELVYGHEYEEPKAESYPNYSKYFCKHCQRPYTPQTDDTLMVILRHLKDDPGILTCSVDGIKYLKGQLCPECHGGGPDRRATV